MERKVVVKLSENAKLHVNITEQMQKDMEECEALASKEGKDCTTCSLSLCGFNTCLCEVPAMEPFLRSENASAETTECTPHWKNRMLNTFLNRG